MSGTGPILRRGTRWGLFALGVGVALGFGLGSLGLLPVADVDIRWTVPALSVSEYVPEALSTEGEDLNRFFLASLYDIQTDVLQLHLALQNDADVVEFRMSRLREKLERYGEDFRQVRDDDRVGDYHRELKGRPGRRWRLPFVGEPAAELQRIRAIRKDFDSGRRRVEQWVEALEAATEQSRRESVLLYREVDAERGVRAYLTGDVRVEGVT